MTRQNKNRTYIVVILLALCALAVDRFVLSGVTGPATVSADEATRELTARIQALTPTGLSIPELPFPRNLPSSNGRPVTRDLFAPVTLETSDATDTLNATKKDRQTFAERNRLEAVISDGSTHIAVINGLWIQPGQSHDGCVLTRVMGNRAHFKCPEGETVLDVCGTHQTRRP